MMLIKCVDNITELANYYVVFLYHTDYATEGMRIKYAGKLKNTFYTSDTKTGKTCSYLLPCQHKQHRATAKPDCSSIPFDKINNCYATMDICRCLYGHCHQQDGASRKEFNRLLEDCNSRQIEIVITKNISRFGRDTIEVLDALHQLKSLGIRVIFEQEELDTRILIVI